MVTTRSFTGRQSQQDKPTSNEQMAEDKDLTQIKDPTGNQQSAENKQATKNKERKKKRRSARNKQRSKLARSKPKTQPSREDEEFPSLEEMFEDYRHNREKVIKTSKAAIPASSILSTNGTPQANIFKPTRIGDLQLTAQV